MKRAVILSLLMTLLVMAVSPSFAQDDDKIEIPVWIGFTDGRLDWTRELAAEFNELYPEYNVVIEGYPSYNDAFDATLLAADQGNPPAVTHFFEAATQEARDAVTADGSPLFKSVEEAIADRTEINGVPVVLDDVVSAAADYYTLDGEFTSMPWNTSSAIMFNNMDILEAAGIEEIPATWGEIEAACAAIAELEDAPESCITWPNHSWFFEQSLGQQGALLANNGNGREARADEVFINSEEAIDYMTWWDSLNDAGYYVYTGTVRDWSGTYNLFIAQDVAFLIYSSSDTSLIMGDSAEAGFAAQASFMPYNENREFEGNLIGGATLWLNNGLAPEVEEGALMFMNWFSNPENAAAWHQLTGYIPITNPAIDLLQEEGWYDENPNSLVASEQLAAAEDTLATRGALIGNFVAIRDVITAAAEDILLNDVDVTERLTEANEEANELLEDYNELFAE